MAHARVTLTIDRKLFEEARLLSGGNFSRFVARMLEERLDEVRRKCLREELRAGYEAEAVHDLEVVGEYRYIDDEAARRKEV